MKVIAFKKVALAVTVGALTVPALADNTDQSGQSAASMLTPADFAWDAGLVNLEEIRLGQVAQSNSHNKAVQKFGMHMVRDHSKLEDRLAKIAASEGLQLPDTNTFYEEVTAPEEKPATEMMAETPQQKLLDAQLDVQQMVSLKGHDFDQAYANAMVKGHEKAMQDFEDASTSVQDSALRKYADKGVKTIRHHYQMAQRLQSQVSKNATASTAIPPM